MRVVSMVPSWTETLIEAGVEVVGRTRFCIHPLEKVKAIPVVGGTKDINWEKLRALEFDFLLLDKEENPKQMSEGSMASVHVTHVTHFSAVADEMRSLSVKFKSPELLKLADRWDNAVSELTSQKGNRVLQLQNLSETKLKQLGIQEWIQKPKSPYDRVVYLIWKNPFMAVTADTFIGSMLDILGIPTELKTSDFARAYPEVDLKNFDPERTLFLFSSEPFPFHKKVAELRELKINSAIIDGESLSWFGIRALRFLENQLK